MSDSLLYVLNILAGACISTLFLIGVNNNALGKTYRLNHAVLLRKRML